ncbi:MAG TPA: hypothetical protein VMH92_13295 [Acidocella sp.]|nr:hypothetical protein [Acidocella sp.]
MKDFRSALLSAASLACLLSLAACGGASNPANNADTASNAGPPEAGAPHGRGMHRDGVAGDPTDFCPQVAVLQQAQTMTLFLPGRSDVAAQVSTAQMTGISGDCAYKQKPNALEVSFTASFLADNGPANNGKPVTLPWFVAITKGNQIIDKHEYQITLSFNGNMSTTAATSKPVKLELPAIPDSAQMEILTGFEMTPDQLAYAASHPDAAP